VNLAGISGKKESLFEN